LLQMTNITKKYAKKLALDNISFQIDSGEVVGLLGRNGAGKSTIMNILTGYLPWNEGTVSIAGIDMAKEPHKAKKHIGYLPEQPPLYDTMTIDEYLAFAGKIKCVQGSELKKQIDEVCESIGLTPERNRLIRNLSKGYRQRVGMAQAMIGNPDILILDEPTVGLDPKQIVEIRSVIKEFGRNRTVMISSHILSEIAEICDRVIVIRDGRLVADRKTTQLDSADSARIRIRVSCAAKAFKPVIESIEGIKKYAHAGVFEKGTSDWEIEYSRNDADFRGRIFDAVVNGGMKLLELSPLKTDIESMFLQLTAEEGATGLMGEETV
jgi:ABC-2 type transport system ATP-binding protein